jgi:hypothetical protein
MVKNLNRVRELIKQATNINNINYNNYINDNNDCVVDSNQVRPEVSDLPVGLASEEALSPEGLKPREIHHVGGSELPASWRGVKWDIYLNKTAKTPKGALKVKMSVILQNRQTLGLIASMNSPHDRIWRGVEDLNTEHWQTVRSEYQDYKSQFGTSLDQWRVSKFYAGRKNRSYDMLALFLHDDGLNFQLRLIADSKIYDYTVPKSSYDLLSQSQRASGQIATKFIGHGAVKMINPKEIGLL